MRVETKPLEDKKKKNTFKIIRIGKFEPEMKAHLPIGMNYDGYFLITDIMKQRRPNKGYGMI